MKRTEQRKQISDNTQKSAETTGKEQIVNPDRYTRGDLSVWDIERIFDEPSLTGFECHLRNTMLEYLLRFPQKNGIEDLRKIGVNLAKLIETLEAREYKSVRQK